MRLAVAALAAAAFAFPAYGEPTWCPNCNAEYATVMSHTLRAGQPLSGFACAVVISPEPGRLPFVYDRPAGRRIGLAGATVIASPKTPVHGFSQILQPNGHYVWIETGKLAPWRSLSNPGTACVPAVMSDGLPGFTYRAG